MSEPQAVWRWPLAIESFFAGMGAAAYVASTAADIMVVRDYAAIARIGTTLGPVLSVLAVVILAIDLGRPERAYRVYGNPRSPITFGSTMLAVFIILGLISMGFWLGVVEVASPIRQAVEVLASIFAIGVIVYPAFLCGTAKNIPLWNTALLPLLLMIVSSFTGLASIALVSAGLGLQQVTLMLSAINFILMALYAIVIFFYLSFMLRSTRTAQESAKLLLTGSLASIFWIGIIAVGLAAPLILSSIPNFIAASVASVCAMIGGLTLRYGVLAAGIPMAPQVFMTTFPFKLKAR